MSRLLDAAARKYAERERRFTCRLTDLELVVRPPSFADREAAEVLALAEWGDRAVRTAFDMRSLEHKARVCLLGIVIREAESGDALGPSLQQLDSDTLAAYDRELDALETPPAEQWTQKDYDGLVELLKKKDPQIARLLSISDGSKLHGLLTYMAAQLSSSTTSN